MWKRLNCTNSNVAQSKCTLCVLYYILVTQTNGNILFLNCLFDQVMIYCVHVFYFLTSSPCAIRSVMSDLWWPPPCFASIHFGPWPSYLLGLVIVAILSGHFYVCFSVCTINKTGFCNPRMYTVGVKVRTFWLDNGMTSFYW